MDRAHELFERLTAGQLGALERILAEEEPENLFLDYKRSVTNGTALETHDRQNLSKAISGFANSEGGLLVWGIDARRQPGSQREEITKRPVSDAASFRTLIEGAISGESIPALANIRTLHILEGGGPGGYVVVLIPQSLVGPVRAMRTDKYHFRSGSSFAVVPHAVLAGMFGRSPRPVIKPNLISYFAQLNERRDQFQISFAVAAGNFGAVLAQKAFLAAWYGDLGEVPRSVDVQVIHQRAYELRRGDLPGFSIVATDGTELAPGGLDQLCNITVTLPYTWRRPFRIEFTLGARDTAPERFYVGFDSNALTTLVRRALEARVPTLELWSTDAEIR